MSNADTHVVERDAPIEGREVEELRVAVGWDRCENKYDGILANSYAHFSVRHANRLAGFLNVISDGIGDAFLLDLMVHPDVRRRGLARALVQTAIEALTADGIRCIQVTFDDHLEDLYRGCGFYIFKGGIIDNEDDTWKRSRQALT